MLNKTFRRVAATSGADVTQMMAARKTTTAGPAVSPMLRQQRLRPRTAALLDVVRQLDATADPHVYREIMQWITQEYEARQGGSLMGLFAKCHLGPPYVDHRLDLFGSICEHFSRADPVPMPYAQARGLAQSGAYAYIELYSDSAMVPILPDGTAVEL